MTQLITNKPWQHIRAAAQAATIPSSVAVAYFGSRGDHYLPLRKGSSLVVDASLGAVRCGITNPTALLRLHTKKVKIFTAPLLHAKVFGFDKVGFVGSTNASDRSAKQLIEAVTKFDDGPTLGALRNFVESLCKDRLGAIDLKWLEGQYSPPKAPLPSLTDEAHDRLLMQIMASDQQGYSGHQVQPPLPAWNAYFGVKLSTPSLPTFTLRNLDTGTVIDRKVVRHTQVLTIDIPEAIPGSIWEVLNVGRHRYDYRVVAQGAAGFSSLNHEVSTTPNPLWNPGRLWILG